MIDERKRRIALIIKEANLKQQLINYDESKSEDKLVKASDVAEQISIRYNIPLYELVDIFAEMPDMRLCASDGKVGGDR